MEQRCPMRRLEEFSLLDPEVQNDPFEFYALLREQSPIYIMPENGIYVVSRYEDCRTVLRDTATFSNVILGMEAIQGEDRADMYQGILRERGWGHVHVLHRTDAPKHSRHRKLVDRVFIASRVKALVPQVDSLAHQLIDRFIDRGECEFVSEFALPLPGIIMGEQLGLDRNDFRRFQSWALAMLETSNRVMTDEELRQTADIELDAQHYLAKIFEDRKKNPTNDLISSLVHAAVEGEEPFTMHELQNLLHQLITGGYETTTSAIAHGVWLLIQHPDQYALLRDDRSLIRNFVEETLRIESPVQGLLRTVTKDTELAGVKIPGGSTLLIRFGAANHDAGTFPKPENFDLKRENAKAHLAFGGGVHSCLGSLLARQEFTSAITAVLNRMDHIELARPLPNPPHVESLNFRPIKELPIRFRKVA
jgi:cytochrome P450